MSDAERRRAAALIERHARGSADAATLMDMLGIEPVVLRLRWARTIELGAAGRITLALDLDVRRLTPHDRAFLGDLGRTLRGFLARQEQLPKLAPTDK